MHFDFPEMMCMYQSLSLSLSIYICKNGLDPDQTRMEFKKECFVNLKIAIRGDGKSPDQKVIDMQLQAANLVYIFDVIILSVTANKSGRLTVETSFLPLNSSKGGKLKCKP